MADKNTKLAVHHANPQSLSQVDEDQSLTPLVDIYEAEDSSACVEVELPGASLGDIDIRVDKGVLTVAAKSAVSAPQGDYAATYLGFAGGNYFRAFTLGDEFDREKIDASFNDGVLTLKIPRAAAAKTRKIEIKG